MASGLNIKHQSSMTPIKLTAIVMALAVVLLTAFYGLRWYTTGDLPPFPLPVAAAGPQVAETPVTAAMLASYKVQTSEPRYVSFSALGIEQARIRPVTVSSTNILNMPYNINDVGWYSESATPASGGVVVLDGRSSGPTQPAVFAGLESVQPGETIAVERGDGTVISYEINDVRSMSITDLNNGGMRQMMEPFESGSEGLSIVATGGNWVPKSREYDRRILVRATIIE